jgi:multicomponent Na+:H+ antiporter subunit B
VSLRARHALFAAASLGLGVFLVWALTGLPSFGNYHGFYGTVLNRIAVPQRHATNVVAGVVFDYRAFDTLGEEFILFAAALSAALLLREVGARAPARRESGAQGEALRAVGTGAVGPLVLLGLAVLAHGYLTPGGGFQSGVVLAAALLLVYLAGSYRAYRAVSPPALVEAGKGLGTGAYAVAGIVALLLGNAYLENFLPLGTPGELASSGTIALLNAAAGVAVSGAFALIFTEFLEEIEAAP